MEKIYNEGSEERTVEILNVDQAEEEASYYDVCCGKFKTATFIGITLSFFNIMTGIDIVMFYSNSLFKGLSVSQTAISLVMGIVNLLSAAGGSALLYCFGRRTLLIAGHITMTISLLLLGIFMLVGNQVVPIIALFIFVMGFEFSSGPITWLYNAEICEDKALGFANGTI